MILVNKSELGAGTRGPSLGFDALRIASLEFGSKITKIEYLEHNNEHLFKKNKHIYDAALNIDGISELFHNNLGKTKHYLSKNANHFIFSADHSSTPLYLAALKSNNLEEKIGVIWVDAHGDLHSPYTTPSGNMHGMPLCIGAADDNQGSKVRDLDSETLSLWEGLKNLGVRGPKYSYDDLVFLGIRDLESEEKAIIEAHNIYYKKVEDVRKEKITRIITEIEGKLSGCDRIFISFDVDSMDPDDTSYGTGTPVEGGFTFKESQEIVDRLTKIDKRISFEMVEINPLLDTENKMAKASYKIFQNVTSNLAIEY